MKHIICNHWKKEAIPMNESIQINESQMRQYAPGLKKPDKKITARIEEGLKRYGDELRSIKFAWIYSRGL